MIEFQFSTISRWMIDSKNIRKMEWNSETSQIFFFFSYSFELLLFVVIIYKKNTIFKIHIYIFSLGILRNC